MKTKEELYADLAYCYVLNSRVRNRTENMLPGFICSLVICLISIPLNTLVALRSYYEGEYLFTGVNIGVAIFCFILLIISIVAIIDCKKQLKKCDDIDKELEELEDSL